MDLARHLPRGTGVFWGQACAEPTPLIDALLDHEDLDVEAFVGMTLHERLVADLPDGVALRSYGALGRLRSPRIADRLDVVACNFSDLPRLFTERRIPGDVGLLQVSPPDADGCCSLGVGVDYIADAIAHARVLVAEINHRMPRTVGGPQIPVDRFAEVIETDRALVALEVRPPTTAETAIARNVAAWIDDGSTIQIGVGGIPTAVLGELHDRADLGLHSGMISDPVVELVERGVLTGARKELDPGLLVTGAALGTDRLFSRLDDLPVRFRPVSYTHASGTLARLGSLVAVNSGIQVDLTGQVNAEVRDGRYVGAVGGQLDFSRAASATGRLSIIAVPACGRGGSTIVPTLEAGTVTTPRADVDVVVTEHGSAWLRGRSLAERAAAIIEIAAPEHRDELAARTRAALTRAG